MPSSGWSRAVSLSTVRMSERPSSRPTWSRHCRGRLPMMRMATLRRGSLRSTRSRTANTNTSVLPLKNSAYGGLQLPVPGHFPTEALLRTKAHEVWYTHVQTGLVARGSLIHACIYANKRRHMSFFDILLQQIVNGLALGMMYALLALGFTMVYGIIELINFAHFSVFMMGTFIGLTVLDLLGFTGSSQALTGFPLVGTLVLVFAVTMFATGLLGMVIERLCLRPMRGISGTAPMITTIGVSFILINVVLMVWGPQTQPFPGIIPDHRWAIGQAEMTFKQLLLGMAGVLLMLALHYLVRRTALGKAMRATAQDADAAQMMGVDVDRIIVLTFFLGSALAGAGSLFFGLYYGFTGFYVGYTIGLRAFTSAVLGGIGNIAGAVLGGLLIGLIQSLGGQLLQVRWTDVIIFSILIGVLVFRPTGLFGVQTPQKA